MPFLTDLDSRAQVKGSRDPLGFVPVWSRFGRKVVGNLTTVSNSLRGFTTLLLGYFFAEAARQKHGSEAGTTLELFLRFEQLAAYSRMHVDRDSDFRGVEVVSRRLSQGFSPKLGASQDRQILSNQKIYGLWGLFSVPAKNSGLLMFDDAVLTSEARDHVEAVLLPLLATKGVRSSAVVDLIAKPSATIHLEGKHAGLAKGIANCLRPKLSSAEAAFYRKHLVYGGAGLTTLGKQQQLATLLAEESTDTFGIVELQRVIDSAEKRGWDALRSDLASIAALEPLLVASQQLFSTLCSNDGETTASIAQDLSARWSKGLGFLRLRTLEDRLPTMTEGYGDASLAERLLHIAQLLSTGDYEGAVRELLEQNRVIMSTRHGSEPWVRLEKNRLRVHFADEADPPAAKQELQRTWRNTYFINSLQSITRAVEG